MTSKFPFPLLNETKPLEGQLKCSGGGTLELTLGSLQAGVSGGHVAIIIIIIVRPIMQQIEGRYYTYYFWKIAQCFTYLLHISYFTNKY
jgi:hypothetical protein